MLQHAELLALIGLFEAKQKAAMLLGHQPRYPSVAVLARAKHVNSAKALTHGDVVYWSGNPHS